MSLYDTVVIGAGLAGLTTACHLQNKGQRVMLIGHGVGALVLGSGCIDVLGYQPVESVEPVRAWPDKLSSFMADHPQHPYSLLGETKINEALHAFQGLTETEYQQNGSENWLVPSAVGAIHPTCLAPPSIAKGHLGDTASMLIVGFEELRDFYPALISQNISAQNLGIETESLTLNLPEPGASKLNITPIELATLFEQADFRQQLVSVIKARCQDYDRIGFPAVLGLGRHAKVVVDLEKQLGRPVFEVGTLPPSVPGRRLFEALKHTFVQAKGRMNIGTKVVAGEVKDGRVTQVQIETTNRLKPIIAENYVLATGGILGGGIQTDDQGRVWEPVFNLPIDHNSNRQTWFTPKFLSPVGQPVSSYGVVVNDRLNPIEDTRPIADNLYIVGSLLAHADWTQGRTGYGVALTTAKHVADLLG
ncbi:anaerobic glycerol-3-phosphate dehydrogenase subunit GlpB [Anaerolineales bacterium HSG24]|nr:anaerobic glycerol-3-phosphate dehydrogenase subunit GlpB [Anaerolineales bacterium HSG24]